MNSVTYEEIMALKGKMGSTTVGKKYGISERTIRQWWKGTRKPVATRPSKVSVIPQTVVSAKRKTLADFRNSYDKSTIIPAKIKAGLRVLGSDGWMMEVEFARESGVSLTDLGNYRDQFADYIVPLERGARRVWAGSPSLAKKMKEML